MTTAERQHSAGRLVNEALGTTNLRRLQLAWALCSTGSWVFAVALAVYAFRQGGAGAVGLAVIARTLPAAVAAPMAGLLADQRSRRDLLLVLAVLRMVVVGAIVAGVAGGAPFAAILVLAGGFTVLSTGHKPAQAGLLTTLAGRPSRLAAANALWSAVDNGGFLVGSVLGGGLVGLAGVEAAMVASAAAYALAAIALTGVERDPVPAHRQALPGATALRETLLGVRTIATDAGLRPVVGLSTATTAVHGAVDVLIVVLALDLLAMGNAGVGWLSAAWGAGGLLGAAGALVLLGRGRLTSALLAGGLLVGLPLCGLAAAPSIVAAIGALALLGVGSALIETGVLTFMQRLSSDEVLARAFAVQEFGLQLTTGLGAIAAPTLVAALGAQGALAVVGALPLLLALTLRFSLSRLEAGVPVPERALALVRGLDLFAPLPLAMQEAIAGRLQRTTVAAGQVVVREGDPGDHFYITAAGEVEVTQRGVRLRRQAAGEGFGEIALVRDVRRTATVTATTDLELLVLDREAFVAAVSGQRRATFAADRLVAEREPSLPSGLGRGAPLSRSSGE
jgi:hypothetical protein